MNKLIPKYQSPWTPINYKLPENSEPKSSKSSSKKINVRGSSVTAEPVSKDRELSYGTGRYSLQLYLNDKPLSGTDPVGEFYVAGEALGPVFKGLGWIGKLLFPYAARFTSGSVRNWIASKSLSNVMNSDALTGGVNRVVLNNGNILLQLASHSARKSRQLKIEPLGNNAFRVHASTWGGLTDTEKKLLYEALYKELPENAKILFPESNPKYLATRGTVASLLRLKRDPRFTPGSTLLKLMYKDDKDNSIKFFEGTSFTKNPELQPKVIFRTIGYKGGDIKDKYSAFFTTDPRYARQYGKVQKYLIESDNFNVAGEPLIGTRDPVGMDMFIYQNTRNNPNSKLIIGHDAITDEFPYLSNGTEMLSLSPNNYTAIKVNKPKTSLKFFERPLSKINNQERLGIPKGKRNFVQRWHVANYPGYLLKGLMKGSLLERLLSKNGTININLLNAYFNKASQIEKEIANKVLAEKFAGQKTIDYNLFKKAVLDELVTYTTKPLAKYSDYGMNRLGFDMNPPTISSIKARFPGRFTLAIKLEKNYIFDREDGTLYSPRDFVNKFKGIDTRPSTHTFTFESPRISVGNNKHYDTTTLGHSRTYTTPDEPNVLHVMESLSDWGQSHVKMMPSVLAHQIAVEKALKSGNTNAFHSFTNRLGSLLADKLTKYERIALENINKEIESGLPSGFLTIEDLWSKKYEILKKAGNRSNIGVLGLHLHDNYLLRQLQENLRYAAENGLTKMRYPTSETAAKIEGYKKEVAPRPTRNREIELRDLLDKMWKEYYDANESQLSNASLLELELIGRKNIPNYAKIMDELELLRNIPDKYEYIPAHQTVLKKYADFPKLFLKLFKDLKVRTVTDTKGNTWYEVDVPKGYLNREWLFKFGGKLISKK